MKGVRENILHRTQAAASAPAPAASLELMRLVFTNLPTSVTFGFVAAGLLAYAVREQVGLENAVGWFACTAMAGLYRLALWLHWSRGERPLPFEGGPNWQTLFEAGALASGLTWGSSAIWIFPVHSVPHQIFLGFVLACAAAASVGTLAVHMRSYALFVLPMLLPYALRLMAQGGDIQVLMGLIFLVGLAFLLANARRFEEITVQSVRLHSENNRLVEASQSALHEARNASHAKTQFLAKVSHEIRTPLNGLVGMAELLAKTGMTQHQRRLTGNLRQSASTLQGLVADLVDISRIENGELSIDRHPFELRTCIEDAIELCAATGYRKGLEVHLIISDPLPTLVNGDAQRLYQVLHNLISSSVRCIEVGQVALRVACTPTQPGRFDVTFSIADNGIGIAHREMERLFAPLTSAETGALQRIDGRDLGLAVTRHLVEKMDGAVTVHNEIGKGTTIRFTLPMEAAGEDAEIMEPEPRCLAGKRILVIDDRPFGVEALTSRVASPQAKINRACCEEEALSMLRRAAAGGSPFDIAIIDRIRPRCDNFSLHRSIVTAPELSTTRVIALMPMQWTMDDQTAAEFGEGAFVSKPVRRSTLLAAVEGALQDPAAPSPEDGTAAAVHRPDAGHSLQGLKVLVVEDNPVNQEVAMAYLDGFGCLATLATNGLEAIQILEHTKFDIVLMDCQMPELDGLSAIQHIREREKRLGLGRLPILMVTANAFASDREQALNAGADDFLSKPYTELQLLSAMRQNAPRPA